MTTYVGMVTLEEAGRRLADYGNADCADFGLSDIGFFHPSETDEEETVRVLRAAARELEDRRTGQKPGAYAVQQRRLHCALQAYLYHLD